jgi:hypothetical protein
VKILVQWHVTKNNSIKETILQMNRDGLIQKIGPFPFCDRCTIPFYMESSYYTGIDKYFIPCLIGCLDYLKKRVALGMINKFFNDERA